MDNYKIFEEHVKNSKHILLLSHVNPDGDTLGSMCAVYGAIFKRFKKKAEMLVLSKVPKNYEFLPYINEAKTIDKLDKSREYDLVIATDVAALDRVLDAQILFEKAKFKINIDHHRTNDGFGDATYIEPHGSSSGEVVYHILKNLNWDFDIDIATCLYTAILTDTGGFRFENTTTEVFKIAADLVSYGIIPKDVFKKCYESKSKSMVLFQNYCVSKANFIKNDKIAYTVIYKKDMEKFNAGDDYTDGIAEVLRAIVTTEVSFVVKEIDSKACKISMRSKGIDVANICTKFNGGGHQFAAGCTIKTSCSDAVKKLLNEIEKELK